MHRICVLIDATTQQLHLNTCNVHSAAAYCMQLCTCSMFTTLAMSIERTCILTPCMLCTIFVFITVCVTKGSPTSVSAQVARRYRAICAGQLIALMSYTSPEYKALFACASANVKTTFIRMRGDSVVIYTAVSTVPTCGRPYVITMCKCWTV
jgi:hypothetical protein